MHASPPQHKTTLPNTPTRAATPAQQHDLPLPAQTGQTILQLQGVIGNQAVQRLIQSGRLPVQREAESPQTPPVPTAEPEEKLSRLRQELLKLFDEFDQQIVGDKNFDAIMTQSSWDAIKKGEAEAIVKYNAAKIKYEEDLAKFQRGELSEKPSLPIPVAKFTTCIETQSSLLRQGLKSVGLEIKKTGKQDRHDFGTEAKERAQKLDADIWHEASPGMSARPRSGDIFILAQRGTKVDKAALELNYIQSMSPGKITKSSEKDSLTATALEAAEDAHAQAESALTALKEAETAPTAAALIKAKGALARATIALNTAKKKASAAAEALRKAEDEIPAAQRKLEKARESVDHEKVFVFSHVGFLESIEPPKNPGEPEVWHTFDGGQTVQKREGEQGAGAERNKRLYNPQTNEISGEKSQGGAARWLQGWLNVDKLGETPYE